MVNSRIENIYGKYLANTVTPEEEREFMAWIKLPANELIAKELFLSAIQKNNSDISFTGEDAKNMIQAIIWADKQEAPVLTPALNPPDNYADAIPETPRVHRVHFLRKWGWAAAAVLAVATGIYFWNSNKKTEQLLVKSNKSLPADVAPGGNKAVLTLADGSSITLDNASNGTIAQQGNAQVVKLANGQIAYNLKGLPVGEIMLNTMSTPNGGQYQLVLPDGTNVWLNAASSITYPAAFVGVKRSVKVTGEAYFEVAKNKAKPFIVEADGKALIEVLGTSFNINSYKNEENIKTTLLEGSVKVSVNAQSALLKPGQQAVVNAGLAATTSPIAISSPVDLSQALAWKDGIFDFNGADLKTVMRQLERWYDIKVQYKGPISNDLFKGKMYRNVNLSDVLEMLKKMGVQFKLEDKNLLVF